MSNPTDKDQQPPSNEQTDATASNKAPANGSSDKDTSSVSEPSRPVKPEALENTPKAAARPPKVNPKPTNKTGKLALFIAILVALLLAAIAAFQYQQNQQVKSILNETQSELAKFRIGFNDQRNKLTNLENAHQTSSKDQSTLIESQQIQSKQLIALTSQFSQLTGIRRQDWEIARLEYLLKTASQRLHLDSDVQGAISALTTADEYLNIINDPALLSVREQINKDLHNLKSLNLLDTSGVYIKLDTLIDEIPQLQPSQPSFELEENDETSSTLDFWDWLSTKLIGLVKITSSEVKPATAWLSAEARDQVNAMLTLRLMHAQQALLTENQSIYQTAITQAIDLTDLVYAGRPKGIAFKDTLNELKTHQVSLDSLDISGSHTALKTHMKKVQQAMQEQLIRHQAQQNQIPESLNSQATEQEGKSQ